MQKRNSGQALVIVLMVIALTVTIAGSAAFRTISQTRQTKETEDAQKASNAARGIIEKILNNEDVDTGTDFGGAGNFNTGVSPVLRQNIASQIHVTPLIPKDSQYMFYLKPYNFDSNDFVVNSDSMNGLEIYFLSDGGCPVLEVIFISTSNAVTKRMVSETCTPNTVSNANLGITTPATPLTINDEEGVSVAFSKYVTINTISTDRMIIIRPLFADTRLAFSHADLPPQGETITSQAQSAGGAQSTQKVVRYYPQIPDFFFATSF